MRNAIRAGSLAALLTASLAGCDGGEAPQVAVEPEVEMVDVTAPGSPLRVVFRWAPATDFTPPREDYKVLVHIVGPDGAVLFQDDHYPPEPTSQWRQGEAQAYERWLYPPEQGGVETLDVVVGLYSPDGRALIRTDGDWSDTVRAHQLEVDDAGQDGRASYLDGWYPQEQPEGATRSWRWSERQAHVLFANPRRDAVLHLGGRAPPAPGGSQTIVVRAGAVELARLERSEPGDFLERIDVPAAALGDQDWVEIVLEIDPVFVPREIDPDSRDGRSLGLQVYRMYLSVR